MREVLAEEMADGALGIGSSLIYAPGSYADTEELVALCEVAGRYGGTYASHVRNEGSGLLSAIDELLEIVRRSGVHGEMWHLKAAGQPEWPLMEHALAKLQAARDDGVPIGADVYPYTRSGTGLSSTIPAALARGRGPRRCTTGSAIPTVRREIRAEMVAIGRYGDTPNAGGRPPAAATPSRQRALAGPHPGRDRRRPRPGPRGHRPRRHRHGTDLGVHGVPRR